LQTSVEDPSPSEITRSPRERVLLLSRKIGEAAVARWCVELLVGGTSYDDPRWPSISWIGGPHAASELRRGEIDARGQEYWTRVWAARALLYAWHPAAEGPVLAGLHDPAWRVREMCAKVARRRGIAAADPVLTRLLDDPVARVRAAAEAALTDSPAKPT